jgi:hypothetical protein
MEINSENRNANIYTRYCSFCRRPGHYANNCNNNPLRDFEFLCRYKIEFLIRYYAEPRQKLLDWLIEYSLENSALIKTFARTYLGIGISNFNIIDIVHEIHNYYCIRHSIPYQREIQAEDLFENIESSHQSDFEEIGENMDDLIDSTILLNLIESSNEENNKRFNIATKIIENSNYCEKQNECFICYEKKNLKNFIKLNCSHEYCKDCIKNQIKHTKTENVHCALCRSVVDNIEIRDILILEEINECII